MAPLTLPQRLARSAHPQGESSELAPSTTPLGSVTVAVAAIDGLTEAVSNLTEPVASPVASVVTCSVATSSGAC